MSNQNIFLVSKNLNQVFPIIFVKNLIFLASPLFQGCVNSSYLLSIKSHLSLIKFPICFLHLNNHLIQHAKISLPSYNYVRTPFQNVSQLCIEFQQNTMKCVNRPTTTRLESNLYRLIVIFAVQTEGCSRSICCFLVLWD